MISPVKMSGRFLVSAPNIITQFERREVSFKVKKDLTVDLFEAHAFLREGVIKS